MAEPSVHDFVVARLTEQLPPKPHWWSRSTPERRAVLRAIERAHFWWSAPHPYVDSGSAIHMLKIQAREFDTHPDYNPVWDSNELFVA